VIRRRILAAAAACLAVTLAVVGAGLAASGALEQYRGGRWQEARAALDAPGDDAATSDALMVRAALARRPDQALTTLDGLIASRAAGDPGAALARLDAAGLRFARGEHRKVLDLLAPLVDGDAAGAPGRALVLAGLARLALGDKDGAAAMLATVKPDDPAFTAARTALGDMALAAREPAKARRYYENADDDTRAGAGRWQALRLEGRDEDAERLRRRLGESDPGCVALLEINRRLRADQDEQAARTTPGAARADTAAAETPTSAAGRYTLQLGAFSDRGLALDLVRRFGDQIPDLRIDTRRDQRGQFLYKVRTGAFVNPALARAEAERLQRSLGVSVFVAETDD
jgi:tetratricopeptide (TPR) repeat protein